MSDFVISRTRGGVLKSNIAQESNGCRFSQTPSSSSRLLAYLSKREKLRMLKVKFFVQLFTVLTVIFLPEMALAHGMSEAEKQAIIGGGNLSYLWLGATHMLSGYDHLAFVFGIIFFLTSFKDIAKYVTAFTLGHSVTLIFATYNGIQLNYFLIDAVIALSVCYIAFSNIDGFRKYLGIKPPSMMLMITGLGLIHGFGLSTRLQELPLNADNLLLNIITFNVGIELGQVAALVVMLLLVSAWRKRDSFTPFSLMANYSLIVFGGLLFLMQMHGYSHGNPDKSEVSTVSPTVAAENMVPTEKWQDSISITIPARGDKEYKLMLEQGKTLEYLWQTDGGPLFFDFHGEPAGDTSGFFQSYKVSTSNQAEGSVKTPFAGTHGWYWKNTSSEAVTIALNIRGDYQRMDK